MTIVPKACAAPADTLATASPRINRQVLPIPKRGYPSLSPIAKPPRLRTLLLPFEDEPAPPKDSRPEDSTLKLEKAEPQPSTAQPPLSPPSPPQLAAMRAAQLMREVKSIEVAGRLGVSTEGNSATVFTSGCQLLDECLPAGGYEAGTVIEYLQNCEGSGATSLALAAAREALMRPIGLV